MIDPLVFVLILLAILVLAGAGWMFARELFFWKATSEQHKLIEQFNATIQKQTECVEAQFDDAERRIDRFEGMSITQKQEIVTLIVDTERRIIESFRDLMRQASNVTIQNSTGGGAANQAGHNQNEQR